MLYKANVALILKGDYKKKGEEFELSADEVKQFDPADIIAVSAIPPEPEPEPEPDVPVDEMSFDQLKAKAKELGLSASGTKADILERIKLNGEEELSA